MTPLAAPARPFARPVQQWTTADGGRGRLGGGGPALHGARSPSRQLVAFLSEGATLRGWLYSHAERTDSEPPRRPALVMTHGFSATITGMVADRYAQRLHASGLQVLLFDHRGFGLSGGSPRRQVNRWTQARGYRDAITFLTRRPDVDPGRVGIWGDSLSGGVAICVAAFDPRVRALVVQVPACGANHAPPSPGRAFETLRTVFNTADLASLPARLVGPAPVVSPDQGRQPSLLRPGTAYRWFMEFGARPGTGWSNDATVVELETQPALHAQLCSPHLTCPSLWVIADDEMPGANPAVSLTAYRSTPAGEGTPQDRGRTLRAPLPRNRCLRPRRRRTVPFPGHAPGSKRTSRLMTVDDDVAVELVRCPECGGVASVEWSTRMSTVLHLKVRCVERHWFFLPADRVIPFGSRRQLVDPDSLDAA